MRVVKISMLIFCAVVLFAPQAAQSAKLYPSAENNQTQTTPNHYTTQSGIIKHHPPAASTMQQQQMYQQQMMQQQGTTYYHQAQQMPVAGCTMCSKIQSANLTPHMRANLMNSLNEFSAQNEPLFNELQMLKNQKLMLQRSAMQSPAQESSLEIQRDNTRKALMKNLKQQRRTLKSNYGMNITEREMIVHKLHQMQGNQAMMSGQQTYSTQMNHGMQQQQQVQSGYRPPQQTNPNYNQEYLINAPMRESYTGQTYE
ncbi:MAG: hypothetical protein ACERJ1_14770 [Halodesulfovibrio sp.]|uniref:hypothetical protein n=1 Tax=Halodesulfovibrio sp. TaxID=1912772 RepID=UPI00359E07DD